MESNERFVYLKSHLLLGRRFFYEFLVVPWLFPPSLARQHISWEQINEEIAWMDVALTLPEHLTYLRVLSVSMRASLLAASWFSR